MLLRIQSVSKSFATGEGPVQVLRDVSFGIERGQSVALTGESGSGKSTLMHLCAGLERPDSGQIAIEGQPIEGLSDHRRARLRRLSIGLVFQQFNLVPSLNVADNLAFQARLAGVHDPVWAEQLGHELGLSALLRRYPEQLSGGQQQRVAIGRALAARPPLILADEPTGNLDEDTSDEVMALMLRLVAESGAGLVMVTHSERLAGRLDHRLHLKAGRIS